jgi:iron-regulated transporter 1
MVHDLGAIGNRLSLERDWVPVLVGPITADLTYGLTQVNSVMVRIDLVCKLVAPSLLPLIISVLGSRTAWILILAVLTVVFWIIEVWCARIITRENSELNVPKVPSNDSATAEDLVIEDQYNHLQPGLQSLPQKMYLILYQDPSVRLRHYFSIPIWPASMASALLQLTVLAYSATLITYLLEIGFTLSSITIARASGAIMALSSTVITPAVVGYMRKRARLKGLRGEQREEKQDDELEGKVVRTVGLWGISFQFLCMVNPSYPIPVFMLIEYLQVPIVLVLWNLSPKSSDQPSNAPAPRAATTYDTSKTASLHPLIPITLFAFLSLSRLGHYMIHLMVQELGQVEIPASQRSTFAGTEQSFKSLFGLCHWAATVVLSRPEQFRFLALGSFLVAGLGVGVFAWWSRRPIRKEGTGYESIAMVDVPREDEDEEC